MSDFIRGGQVTFHNFRMLMQVVKMLAKVSIILLFITIIYSFYKNSSLSDWIVISKYIKKSFSNSLTIALENSFELVIKKFEQILFKGFISAIIIEAVVIGSCVIFFWFRGRKIKQLKKLRGIFALTDKDLRKQIIKHNNKFKRFSLFGFSHFFNNYKPFSIAGFKYPISGKSNSWNASEQSHTLILGSTGSGKTTIIKDLIYQLYKRNQKAIIVDIKGDMIENFYSEKRGDIILNPLDLRGRNWSFFKETNPLKGFATIAKSLLPKESKSDPIWIDAARVVVAELASLYVSENLSMDDFADKILKTDLASLSKLLERTSASKIINENIEKASLSVLMVLSTYLKPFKLYQSSGNCFSITEWINDPSQQHFLFISSRADVKEDLNPIISTQVDIAINAVRALTTSSNIPKIWFILDELAYFDQAIPTLKDGLATARSFGGCFVLGTQDISSIAKIYSREHAESIANNCKTKVFMNVTGKESATWCSDLLGEGEIEQWQEGLSYGAHEMRDGIQVNHNQKLKKIVLPSELLMLKSGEGYISFAGFAPAKFKFENQIYKKIAPSYIENLDLYQKFQSDSIEAENIRKEIEKKLTSSSKQTQAQLTKTKDKSLRDNSVIMSEEL